ncbi:MAG TPA: protein kinase, partial [Chloroflexota bacterium]|nr:protein kinase [Chloroflexota bacterium]
MAKQKHAELIATRYELLERIGVGGVANVYRARDVRLDRIVALKVLRDEYAADPEFVGRFQREARIAAGLSHPNVVSVDDFGPHDGTAFIAMDYVDGETLKERLRRVGRLSPDEAVAIARQVLAGLAVAHAGGLVHRDVKPHNVLLGWDGSVKLTDFGIAGSAASVGLTQTGTTVGTAAYAAPELVSGGVTGPPTDVYGAGMLLYEMLVGHPPFQGGTLIELAYRHVHEPPRPPSELVEGVPPALEALIERALAKDPAARFAAADDMLRALERLGLGGAASAPLPAASGAPRGQPFEPTVAMPVFAAVDAPDEGGATARLRRRLSGRRRRLVAVPALIGALVLGGLLGAPRLALPGTWPDAAPTQEPTAAVLGEAATPAPPAEPSPAAAPTVPPDRLSGPLWTVPLDERPAPRPGEPPPTARPATGGGGPARAANLGAPAPPQAAPPPPRAPSPTPAPPEAPPPQSSQPAPSGASGAGPAPTAAPTAPPAPT